MALQPSGLLYFPNFIPNDLYDKVVDFLNQSNDWQCVGIPEQSRKVLQYGFEYKYRSAQTDIKINPIPAVIDELRTLIKSINNVPEEMPFNQCIINRYLPGQGIAPHVDSPQFEDYICCFTLGSGGTMVFQHPQHGKFELFVEPRSVYLMSGAARYEWKHSMSGKKSDKVNNVKLLRETRISVTFRSVLK